MRHAPHPFTLRQLQYALAVAETRNFHRAAALCHVSQPSLSAQIAQLEEMLGVTLFERDRRRVVPTAAGEELLGHARQILLAADALLDMAVQLGEPLVGKLRIGVIPTMAPYLLPEFVPALRVRHPDLGVTWIEEKTAVLRGLLGARELDAALLALEPDLGDMAQEILGRDPFVLAMAKGDPLAQRDGPVEIEELSGATVLLLEDGHCFREQALPFCAEARAKEAELRATSLPTLVQMTAAGAGVTLLPLLSLPTENRHGDLAIRTLVAPAPGRTVALLWRSSSPRERSLRALSATLREVYQALEPRLQACLPRRSKGKALGGV
ncbi:LysR substrate-binding domain-containing protein [Chondromyces crocatus]|uniref:Transcriptional regulator n=1 Tax=Chondromyces crocatus TaxID=52 RepID=A0A0K1ENW4_CHOCO|nr:LysR substrate-binding domain-containing protein [Chondromyces crocatus]AKT42342.1 transcriptional regulator [Chondromyces crocatus]